MPHCAMPLIRQLLYACYAIAWPLSLLHATFSADYAAAAMLRHADILLMSMPLYADAAAIFLPPLLILRYAAAMPLRY